jgi:hypothetical protein
VLRLLDAQGYPAPCWSATPWARWWPCRPRFWRPTGSSPSPSSTAGGRATMVPRRSSRRQAPSSPPGWPAPLAAAA